MPRSPDEFRRVLLARFIARFVEDITWEARKHRLTEEDITRIEQRALHVIGSSKSMATEIDAFQVEATIAAVIASLEEMFEQIRLRRVAHADRA